MWADLDYSALRSRVRYRDIESLRPGTVTSSLNLALTYFSAWVAMGVIVSLSS